MVCGAPDIYIYMHGLVFGSVKTIEENADESGARQRFPATVHTCNLYN